MIMPNSVFGLCRCRCREHFHGPRCQFVSKRVADAAPSLSFDTQRAAAASITSSPDDDGGRGFIPPAVREIISQLHEKRRLTDFHAE